MPRKWGRKSKEVIGGDVPATIDKPERVSNKLDHIVVAAEREPSFRERMSKKLKGKQYLKVGGAVLLVIAILAGYLVYNRWFAKKPATGKGLSAEQLKLKDNNSVEDVVRRYSTDYDDSSKDLQSKNYTQWDKATLDKAYFNLLYADKAGLFTQVYETLAQIEGAKMSGLNIDDNSYGIGQTERDAIKKRADAERGGIQ